MPQYIRFLCFPHLIIHMPGRCTRQASILACMCLAVVKHWELFYVYEDGSVHSSIWVSVMLPSPGEPAMAGAFGGAPHVPHSGR
jgi:hypothetical protein